MSGIIGQAGSRSGVIPYGEIEYEKGLGHPQLLEQQYLVPTSFLAVTQKLVG